MQRSAVTVAEIIVVRSLAESDLGLILALRTREVGRQRAININSKVCASILSPDLYESGGADFHCAIRFGDVALDEVRPLRRTGKNWRLGGPAITAPGFERLDSKDFMLLRTVEGNDGGHPLSLVFVSRNEDRVLQCGVSALIGDRLGQSMAAFREEHELFPALALHCPPAPATPRTTSRSGQSELFNDALRSRV